MATAVSMTLVEFGASGMQCNRTGDFGFIERCYASYVDADYKTNKLKYQRISATCSQFNATELCMLLHTLSQCACIVCIYICVNSASARAAIV